MSDTTRDLHAADTDDLPATADDQPGPHPTEPPPARDDSYESDFAPVIRSKIQPPALRSTTLTRQRLIDRLHESTASRVTLIVAEAGYGKTTLLADFAARSGQRTLWYRLDPTDGDAITWTNYLIAACREVVPKFGAATTSLLAQVGAAGPPNHVFIASLVDELRHLGEAPTLLVLDDFHAVDASTEAREIVERLLRDAPPWMHFVIATRRRPSLRFGRLEAMGELAQIGTDELRFAVEETEDLFAERYNTPLEGDVLQVVDRRTRGWAASLQLFYGSIRNKPASAARSLANLLSGAESPIYDFLAEEVLANIPADVEAMLVRASILDRLVAEHVAALFDDVGTRPTTAKAEAWIEEADHLGLVSRSSESSAARQIHPLLRDFLGRRLRSKMDSEAIAAMHVRLARAIQRSEPLIAARHFLEAGQDLEAMRCLGGSVMHTMGSGQWGVASDLIDRLKGVPADPAVAAIQSRRYIEEGDLDRAAQLLARVDATNAPADVRAVFRHAKLSLGWRTGDRDLMVATLDEVRADDETPPILRDIFAFYVDASSLSAVPYSYASLASRLERMAVDQTSAGHIYFSAISRHNASLMCVAAGRFRDAVRLANDSIANFDLVPGVDYERYSTHAILAMCSLEQGDQSSAEEHMRFALSSGAERGDVHADIAYALATIGDYSRASRLLESATELRRAGRSDVSGDVVSALTRAVIAMPTSPNTALREVDSIPRGLPLDTGYDLDRQTLSITARLVAGETDRALEELQIAKTVAAAKDSRRTEGRLLLLSAIANQDSDALRSALTAAAGVGELAILSVADALGLHLWLIPECPAQLRGSIGAWRSRWLPVLRRQLEQGGTANSLVAATLLDEFGEVSDVVRLRAFVKTYRRHTRGAQGLGRQLARKVAPPLVIRDLGRTVLSIGDRAVALGEMRRKSSSLLMYLVTRPSHSANRDQVLEELWPDSDPSAASNNLNQSLYFLRRDIDPWFEDDVSVDYIMFQSDLLWLEPALVRIASADFVLQARSPVGDFGAEGAALSVLGMYAGRFCPEFEYEEWAIGWANRVHALFLQLARGTIQHYVGQQQLQDAREAAILALAHDPTSRDIEQKLVWLYWHEGARSSAIAQFEHLTSQERADGVEPSSFEHLTGDRLP
jgi:ATP-dependent transcriptional regulator